MKRIFSAFLAVVMIAVMVPVTEISAADTEGTCGDNLTWTLDTTTGELVISGTGYMKDYYYEDYPYNDYVHSDEFYSTAPWGSYLDTITKITIS